MLQKPQILIGNTDIILSDREQICRSVFPFLLDFKYQPQHRSQQLRAFYYNDFHTKYLRSFGSLPEFAVYFILCRKNRFGYSSHFAADNKQHSLLKRNNSFILGYLIANTEWEKTAEFYIGNRVLCAFDSQSFNEISVRKQ